MTQAQVQTSTTESSNPFVNGMKLVGEALLPGTSLLVDGKFINGAAHAVVGLGARVALGPVAVAFVCADSFSKSVSDKFLWDHASDAYKAAVEMRASAKAAKEEAKAKAAEEAEAAKVSVVVESAAV